MLHKFLTAVAVTLGPRNPLIRTYLSRSTSRFGVRCKINNGHLLILKDSRAIQIAERHFAFVPDLAAHFDLYYGLSGVEIGVVDYSAPHLHRYPDGLEFEVSCLPEEETDYFHWYTPRPGETVFDIGAYCGVTTYRLAQLVYPGGRVVAFEPDCANFELLVRNIERHRLANVTAVPIAVAGNCGRASFACEATLGSGLTRNLSRAAQVQQEVETVSLEAACERYGLPRFIKIDAEGSEIEILSGAMPLLRKHEFHFALDTNHRWHGALTNTAVERIFRSCGYEVESSDAGGFMTTWARPALT